MGRWLRCVTLIIAVALVPGVLAARGAQMRPVESVHRVITDRAADAAMLRILRERDVEVLLV